MDQTPSLKQANSIEIHFFELIQFIWSERWRIAKVTFAFMVMGIVIAFTTTAQYKAEARLLPELGETKGGASALLRQFSGIGGLSGLSLPGTEGLDAIRPDLYPNVLTSTPFYLHLMKQIITSPAGQESTLESYLNSNKKGSLIGTIIEYITGISWKSSNRELNKVEIETLYELIGITHISKEQYGLIKKLRQKIHAGIHQKSGIINVSAEFSDPWIAAQVAQIAVDYLTTYVTDYRIAKAQMDMEFTIERHTEKEMEFYKAQLSLARFRDANRNIISAAAQIEEQQLQDQFNLAFNTYNILAQQLEQARIKVQEKTPVINILEPVQIPVEKSKPKKTLTIVAYIFLGGFAGVGFILGKYFWAKTIRQL